MPDILLSALPHLFSGRTRPLVAWPGVLVRGISLILAVAVALVSYCYLFDIGPVPPSSPPTAAVRSG